MNILCIETSGALCSTAIFKDGEIFYCENTKTMAHAEALMDSISTGMDKAKIGMNQLDAVALSGGPGSYTGLRIGCSSAKGICYALGIPLIAIDTLKIIAFEALQRDHDSQYFWTMIDARRMEVYHAIYNRNLEQLGSTRSEIITDEGFMPDFINGKRTVLCGDGAAKAAPILKLNDAEIIANAAGMCKLAEQAYRESNFVDVAYYEPFYLKQANITVSKS